MPLSKHIFVGRKSELEQFQQALGKPNWLARLLGNAALNVKPRVFLPYGIGGIGKTELSKRCLALAEKAGWHSISVDWDRAENRPAEPAELMDAIAQAIQSKCGENAVGAYLKDRKKAAQTQERVQRYRTEHPEEWQRLVEKARQVAAPASAAMPDPTTKTLAAAIPATLDYGPKVIAKAYDLLLAEMERRKLLLADEVSLFKDTDARLAHHLVEVIVHAAKDLGLAILLDAGEILSVRLEEFLRDMIACPAVEQGSGLIFIVTGRYNQYREREVEDSDGQRRRVKGYADRLTDPPPITWDLSLFADPEIEDYLRECKLPATVETVAFVQGAARGVPFAVQLIVEAVLNLGPERAQKEFPPKDPAELNLQEMVTLVVRRFLRYCVDAQDEQRLNALAMLRSRDHEALRAMWQLSPSDNPRQILTELETRYGFVQPGGTLHEIVRDFLRDNLRLDDRETARRLGRLAADHFTARWEAETATLAVLAERIAEDRWRGLTLDLLNAWCWAEESAAMRFVAGRALEALEFNWGFAKGLVRTAREFRKAANWWAGRSCRQFDALTKAVVERKTDEMAGLEALEREAAELKLDNVQRCILLMWRARNLAEQGKPSEALQACIAAEKMLPVDDSVRRALARRYAAVGSDLGFKKGAAVRSPEGKMAYERAVALDQTVAGYHNGLGAMC